ncbi:formate dehydrogenase subunit gamma [Anaeromyxobacter paludicola]|uniref:Formate dehydrogenase cytochrome b556 subunit n=1 Tax=Anaeromyxobacter paludicola TaxID=2918171 RepID=A0ABM7XFP0_9BACT|nr:formate dehydrogenase subunit gamma [Anaeromyxobacter paludicola]BDG10719.1 formate dehydrogenase cytochrome b556 subunit [Anaeromyxobacter paludicola]
MSVTPPRHGHAFAAERPPDALQRYSEASRLTHWAVALAYVLLFCSGLALFHPFFFWLSGLFGSAALMRVLHPFIGVALAVLFFAYASRLWRENLLLPSDRRWLRGMLGYMTGRDELRVEGKYNAGQKLMYWSMIGFVAGLLATGLLLWRPYVAPAIPVDGRRLAAVLHAVFAFVMFVGIGVHVYAALWTRGSMRAMTQGWVTRRWARYHHPGWYERETAGEPPPDRRESA